MNMLSRAAVRLSALFAYAVLSAHPAIAQQRIVTPNPSVSALPGPFAFTGSEWMNFRQDREAVTAPISTVIGQAMIAAPAASSITGAELIPCIQGGLVKRCASGQVGGGSAAFTPRIRIVSPQGFNSATGVTLSNGSATSGSYRPAFKVNTAVRGLQFIFMNGIYGSSGLLTGASGSAAPGNAIKLTSVMDAAPQVVPISTPASLGTPISSGGRTASALGDLQFDITEPLHGQVYLPGTVYFYRTTVAVNAGEKWPYMYGTDNYNWVAGGRTSDTVYGTTLKDGSDLTISYSNSGAGYASTAYTFGAAAIVGEQITPLSVVLVAGDSISNGAGDQIGRGYEVRALETAGLGYFPAGIGGSTMGNQAVYPQLPQRLANFADHVWSHIGTNDLSTSPTLDTMKARLLAYAQAYSSSRAKLWFSTVLARTNSTDGWATYANQTKNSWEDTRILFNNFERDATSTGARAYLIANGIPAARIGGFVDVTRYQERNADGSTVAQDANGQQALGTGGLFVATSTLGSAPTVDGTHPSAALATVIAAQPEVTAAVAAMAILPVPVPVQ